MFEFFVQLILFSSLCFFLCLCSCCICVYLYDMFHSVMPIDIWIGFGLLTWGTNDIGNQWELGNIDYLWEPMTWRTGENWATMVTCGDQWHGEPTKTGQQWLPRETNEMCDQRVGETNGMGDQCNGWCMCDNLEPSEMGNQCCALHDPEVSLSSWMLSLRPCHGVVSTSSTVFGSLWYDIFCRNQ